MSAPPSDTATSIGALGDPIQHLFAPGARVTVLGRRIARRIDVRALERGALIGRNPEVLRVGPGCAVLFRYGAVVMFGLDGPTEGDFLASIAPYVQDRSEQPQSEALTLEVVPGQPDQVRVTGILPGATEVQVGAMDLGRVQLVAEVLARSIVLEFYEQTIALSFDRVEPLAQKLRQDGRLAFRSRDLVRHISDVLVHQHQMVGRIDVPNKPDLLWEQPELERLYGILEHEFELKDRHVAVNQKLELISETVHTALDLLHAKRSLRVEWWIVILIVVEICLTLYEMFIRNH